MLIANANLDELEARVSTQSSFFGREDGTGRTYTHIEILEEMDE